jgi:hypothetical protein
MNDSSKPPPPQQQGGGHIRSLSSGSASLMVHKLFFPAYNAIAGAGASNNDNDNYNTDLLLSNRSMLDQEDDDVLRDDVHTTMSTAETELFDNQTKETTPLCGRPNASQFTDSGHDGGTTSRRGRQTKQ